MVETQRRALAQPAPLEVAAPEPGRTAQPVPLGRRLALRIIFACALLVAAGGAILRLPLTGLSQDQQFTLLVLAATTLAADVFSLDFPDRKRISGGYIFPLLA